MVVRFRKTVKDKLDGIFGSRVDAETGIERDWHTLRGENHLVGGTGMRAA